MLFYSILVTFVLWLLLVILSFIGFPFSFLIFQKFRDRGWAFNRVISIILISYSIWLLASIKLVPFRDWSLWLIVLIVFLTASLLGKKCSNSIKTFITKAWKLILLEEILFFSIFFFWSMVRAYAPEINGLEKFMDFGFVNSILRANYFPPKDMWLAGETINYYYFGHLITAVLTKLSGLPSQVTYNLMIATLASLAFTESFSLGMNYLSLFLKTTRKFFAFLSGLVSAFTLTFAGNLHTVFTRITQPEKSYWYPDATRYIPYTIHEFPLYSFVVSDLHGHVSDIPLVIFTLALIINLVSTILPKIKKQLMRSLLLTSFIGFMTGILYMTNALDGIIYLCLSLLLIAMASFSKKEKKQSVVYILALGGALLLSSLLSSLLFHLNFIPFAKGIDLVKTHSSIAQLIVLWGFFLFVGLSFIYLWCLMNGNKKEEGAKLNNIYLLTLAMIAFSFFLVVIPEFVYIKDIYIAEYHRANTMFKLVYQTFMIMAIITGPVTALLVYSLFMNKCRVMTYLFTLISFSGLISIFIYPYHAITSYYGSFRAFQGIDGLNWIKTKYPDDFAALNWIKENIKGQPVILEAVGESYTDFARISANSGLPTVLGWRVHEWLWRGSFDVPGKRTNDVATLYTTDNKELACSMINKHRIAYVYIGNLERQQYPSLNEEVFIQIGTVVFSKNNSRLYALKGCESDT